MTPTTPRPMTFLSLFAGIGGFDLGLAQAGLRCVGQVEIDPAACSVLARHFPEVPRHDDVRTTLAWWRAQPRPHLDLLTAGFPCQDLSTAGRRAGLAGPRSGLFFDLARAIGGLRPRWLLLENVPGLLSSRHGADFAVALATLGQLGYGLAWRVLDSQHFGVAQRRRRVFVVGRRGAVCPFEVLFEPQGRPRDPAPRRPPPPSPARTPRAGATGGRSRPADQRRHDAGRVATTLTASLGHHGHSSPRGDASDNLLVQSVAQPGATTGPLLANAGGQRTTDLNTPLVPARPEQVTPTPSAGRVRSLAENQRGELRTTELATSISAGGGKPGQGYPAVLVDTGSPSRYPAGQHAVVSGTLTGRCGKGPSSTVDDGVIVTCMPAQPAGPLPTRSAVGPARARQTGADAGTTLSPVMVRRLTPVECERLQGFPDGWTAHGADQRPISDTARYRLIGNAVTVPVVAWIGARLAAADHANRQPCPCGGGGG
jgi:DNA (cytosine-5)-methyltransferase 1